MRIEGLAHADGLQLAQGVGDVFVVLGEELLREVDDGAGDALRRVRSGLRPGSQRGHEDPPEGLQGEGVRARLAGLRAGQRGDRYDDAFGDVDEQLGHPRCNTGELVGGVDVVGLGGPEVAEGADGLVRSHRGERRGVGHVGSSRTGRPADRGGSEPMLGSRPCGQSPAPTGENSPPSG
ncbi:MULTISPECIES: hypothetical protein [Streptomyces]|uniref:Uncharacterized protein n=1 Tax=Streptomyces flaveolus TaxID=67297 RepID=A0ABV3AQ40_9ACTN|nr:MULTISPECIES: hypothetical protein [Streptomyces]